MGMESQTWNIDRGIVAQPLFMVSSPVVDTSPDGGHTCGDERSDGDVEDDVGAGEDRNVRKVLIMNIKILFTG